jgi:hypothetical protein
MSLTYTEAFAKFGAKLNNQQWSVSAFGADGCFVVSLWQDWIKPGEMKGTLIYRDTLSQWKGNDVGRNEFRNHLGAVQISKVPIKLVIARPRSASDAALVGQVTDESKIKKTFAVREDLVGSLEEFDGDALCIVFRRAG